MNDADEYVANIKDRAKKKLERDMGPLLMDALNDPRTVELMLNADGRLWQDLPMKIVLDFSVPLILPSIFLRHLKFTYMNFGDVFAITQWLRQPAATA
jgi:hypothetical protein